jgi:hypothetical protein
LFNSASVAEIHPGRLLVPVLPWSGAEVFDLRLWFLQWENVIGEIAILLWAALRYFYTCGQRQSFIALGLRIVLLTPFAGPVGAAVVLMWERDSVLWSIAVQEQAIHRKQGHAAG